jgi:hypothetical protein
LTLTCLIYGLLCVGLAGHAAVRPDLYQATAPVADRSEAGRAAAFQTALKMVLVRITGNRAADQDPALAPLVSDAGRFVQQYRAAPDNQVWVAFDGPALERWLAQNGQPLWGRERPATAIFLAVQSGAQSGTVLTRDDTSDLKSAIDAAAMARGIPLIWPGAAELQNSRLDYAAVVNGAPTTLAEIGRRLGAEGALIGHAQGAGVNANVRWTHVFQDQSREFSGALEGVNRAADTYAALFAASGNLVPLEIEVSGVGDLRQYADVENYLESRSFIAHVSVESLIADTIRFRITTRGGAAPLQRALAMNGPLEPIAATDGGVQRFHLRR